MRLKYLPFLKGRKLLNAVAVSKSVLSQQLKYPTVLVRRFCRSDGEGYARHSVVTEPVSFSLLGKHNRVSTVNAIVEG